MSKRILLPIVVLFIGLMAVLLYWRISVSTALMSYGGTLHVNALGGRVAVQYQDRLAVLDDYGKVIHDVEMLELGVSGLISDLHLESDGHLLLGVLYQNRLLRCDLATTSCKEFARWPEGMITGAYKFALDPETGQLFLSDGAGDRLFRHSKTAGLKTLSAEYQLNAPNRVRVSDGLITVADTNRFRLVQFRVDGKGGLETVLSFSTRSHPEKRRGHIWPIDFVRTRDGIWWVLNGNGRLKNADLLRFDPKGAPLDRIVLPENADPSAIASLGNAVLVTDFDGNALYRVSSDGTIAAFGSGEFNRGLERARQRRAGLQSQMDWALGLMIALAVVGVGFALWVEKRHPRSVELFPRKQNDDYWDPDYRPEPDSSGTIWMNPDPVAIRQIRRTTRGGMVMTILCMLMVTGFLVWKSKLQSCGEEVCATDWRGAFQDHAFFIQLLWMFCIFFVLHYFNERLVSIRVGLAGDRILLCLPEGRVETCRPESMLYSKRHIAFGRHMLPLSLGVHGRPFYHPRLLEILEREYFPRGRPLGALEFLLHMIKNGNTSLRVTLFAVVTTTALWLFLALL